MTAGTKVHRTAVTMKKESMAKLKKESMAKKEESKFKSSEEAERFNAEALKNTLRPDFKGSPKATENTKKFMKKYNLTEIPDRVDFAKLEADRKKRKENVRVKTLPEVEVTATKMKKPATKLKVDEKFPRKLTKFDKLKMEKNRAKKDDGGRSKAKPAQKVVEKKPAAPKMKKPAVKLKHKNK